MHVKANITSICTAYFLAEYFAKEVEDFCKFFFAAFITFYFTCADGLMHVTCDNCFNVLLSTFGTSRVGQTLPPTIGLIVHVYGRCRPIGNADVFHVLIRA